jgi:hypothetical protein
MNFDIFLEMFGDELLELWRTSTHYITTDYGKFIEMKYDIFMKRGSL